MNIPGLAFIALFAIAGLAMALKAAALKSWITRVYDNPRMTRHMNLPGYVGSLRLVGAGLFVFASAILVSAVVHQISN